MFQTALNIINSNNQAFFPQGQNDMKLAVIFFFHYPQFRARKRIFSDLPIWDHFLKG